MKKLFLVLFIGLLLSTAAFADHESLGIGAVFSGGGGLGGGGFYPGLSLKFPSLPIFWGVHAHIGGHFGFGATGDFYFFDSNLISDNLVNEDGIYRLKLDWYLGVGALGEFQFGRNWAGFNLGVRIPVGLSWHVVQQFEITLGTAPTLGLWAGDGGAKFFWRIPIEMAFRYWVNNQTEARNEY